MEEFFIKKGDVLPKIMATLKDAAGVVVDLTSASSVEFIYRRFGTGTSVAREAVVEQPLSAGKVSYAWVAEDTVQAGSMRAEWRVTWSGGKKASFPNDGYIILRVSEGLGVS
jgi:hypothetical protein